MTIQEVAEGKSVTTYEYDRAGNWNRALMKNESGISPETATAPYCIVQERGIVYYENPNTGWIRIDFEDGQTRRCRGEL